MSTEDSPTATHFDDPEYKDILVPTDRSDNSQLALAHAISLAHAFDGQIHALSVDEGAASSQRDQIRTDSEELAEAATAEAAERAKKKDVPVTVVVESGSPEQAIRGYAEKADVDIIVMGTEGRSGIKGAIFGSVAEKTVRESPVPVLTVKHEDGDSE